MNMSKKIAALDALRRFIDNDNGPLADGDVYLMVEVRSLNSTRRLRYSDAKGRRRIFTRTITTRPKSTGVRHLEDMVSPTDLARLDELLR